MRKGSAAVPSCSECGEPIGEPEAVEYARWRLRPEVRIRADALRRLLGGGSVTVQAVLGSLPVFVRFAERRLAPIFEANILSPPARDVIGEEALAAAVMPRAAGEDRPQRQHSQRPLGR